MQNALPGPVPNQPRDDDSPYRSYLVQAALRLTAGILPAPSLVEQRLLQAYVEGRLTIDQVIARLEIDLLLEATGLSAHEVCEIKRLLLKVTDAAS